MSDQGDEWADRGAQRVAHDAIEGLLDDGEMAVSWVLAIDVVGPDDVRYLAHRSGGGIDGAAAPTLWAGMGMLRAALIAADKQIGESTSDA